MLDGILPSHSNHTGSSSIDLRGSRLPKATGLGVCDRERASLLQMHSILSSTQEQHQSSLWSEQLVLLKQVPHGQSGLRDGNHDSRGRLLNCAAEGKHPTDPQSFASPRTYLPTYATPC